MKSQILVSFSVFVLFAAFQADLANALCCPWFLTPDVKCQCEDGENVHPWECCSLGSCNVFCCNCDGACRSNSTLVDLDKILPRFKRNDDDNGVDVDAETLNSALNFRAIDKNDDGALSFDETLNYIGFRFKSRPTVPPSWFRDIDFNGNGFIDPFEFDQDLTAEIVKRVGN